VVEPILPEIDLLLVMTVNPGFAGQSFIEATLPKIQAAREMMDRSKLKTILEVDGGIKLNNIGEVAALGPDWFVSGSGIFATPDYKTTVTSMRHAIHP
jgi:ribulose-phosphate 3-epimerase